MTPCDSVSCKKNIPGITKKMLTSQLRELEHHNIVNRKIYAEIPPKVEYSMTEYGKGLIPILELMNKWGHAHVLHLSKLYAVEKAEQKS
jgi:DNA-binding HxlR family transcriptional regulator